MYKDAVNEYIQLLYANRKKKHKVAITETIKSPLQKPEN